MVISNLQTNGREGNRRAKNVSVKSLSEAVTDDIGKKKRQVGK